ncbi:MAG TPA: HAMP domain-containing sensor histidine kinase [Gemmatimonadales bacterium]|nr:HAMP domain-containing sensor histidine kinase [Gemmatimonadales bacterium]
MSPAAPAAPARRSMPLSQRVALVTALTSVLLVLGATEAALTWSQRSRLADLRDESVALAGSWAAYLSKAAPTGSPAALAQALENWPSQHIAATRAWVYVPGAATATWPVAVASDSGLAPPPVAADRRAYARGTTEVWLSDDSTPMWNVATPFGNRAAAAAAAPSSAKPVNPDRVPHRAGRARAHPAHAAAAASAPAAARAPAGVLHVQVSVLRLSEWARTERQRAYALGGLAALLVATFVGVLTSRWVGRPLAELGRTMSLAHGGAEGAPPAAERGAGEFRVLARRYNELREALARRQRESEARAALLALEERARAFDRLALMEETVAGFAHEIGTPLNTVSGHLQLLRDDLARGDGVGRYDGDGALARVQLLLGQIDRLAGIVRTRLARGAWPQPASQTADLARVAERMLRFMEPSLAEGGIVAELEGGNAVALCDPARVEQILLNLLKNAIEALPPGGHVTIAVGTQDAAGARSAWLEVADDGPGLAPELQQQLFNPFATTKGSAGTGLGLAVSRRLARSLGGDLVHVPRERGTAWRLTLPAAPAASAAPAATHADRPEAAHVRPA